VIGIASVIQNWMWKQATVQFFMVRGHDYWSPDITVAPTVRPLEWQRHKKFK
jgi:hypothetical protein